MNTVAWNSRIATQLRSSEGSGSIAEVCLIRLSLCLQAWKFSGSMSALSMIKIFHMLYILLRISRGFSKVSQRLLKGVPKVLQRFLVDTFRVWPVKAGWPKVSLPPGMLLLLLLPHLCSTILSGKCSVTCIFTRTNCNLMTEKKNHRAKENYRN